MEDGDIPGLSSRRPPLQRWGDLKPAHVLLPGKFQVSMHQKAKHHQNAAFHEGEGKQLVDYCSHPEFREDLKY